MSLLEGHLSGVSALKELTILFDILLQDIDYAENANKTYTELMSGKFMEVSSCLYLGKK